MIGACASNSSLTHTVVSGFSEILERLTNTQMIAAEKKGLHRTQLQQRKTGVD